ncbi:hypothetical protein [Pseudonocardia sp. DLS-67]
MALVVVALASAVAVAVLPETRGVEPAPVVAVGLEPAGEAGTTADVLTNQ